MPINAVDSRPQKTPVPQPDAHSTELFFEVVGGIGEIATEAMSRFAETFPQEMRRDARRGASGLSYVVDLPINLVQRLIESQDGPAPWKEATVATAVDQGTAIVLSRCIGDGPALTVRLVSQVANRAINSMPLEKMSPEQREMFERTRPPPYIPTSIDDPGNLAECYATVKGAALLDEGIESVIQWLNAPPKPEEPKEPLPPHLRAVLTKMGLPVWTPESVLPKSEFIDLVRRSRNHPAPAARGDQASSVHPKEKSSEHLSTFSAATESVVDARSRSSSSSRSGGLLPRTATLTAQPFQAIHAPKPHVHILQLSSPTIDDPEIQRCFKDIKSNMNTLTGYYGTAPGQLSDFVRTADQLSNHQNQRLFSESFDQIVRLSGDYLCRLEENKNYSEDEKKAASIFLANHLQFLAGSLESTADHVVAHTGRAPYVKGKQAELDSLFKRVNSLLQPKEVKANSATPVIPPQEKAAMAQAAMATADSPSAAKAPTQEVPLPVTRAMPQMHKTLVDTLPRKELERRAASELPLVQVRNRLGIKENLGEYVGCDRSEVYRKLSPEARDHVDNMIVQLGIVVAKDVAIPLAKKSAQFIGSVVHSLARSTYEATRGKDWYHEEKIRSHRDDVLRLSETILAYHRHLSPDQGAYLSSVRSAAYRQSHAFSTVWGGETLYSVGGVNETTSLAFREAHRVFETNRSVFLTSPSYIHSIMENLQSLFQDSRLQTHFATHIAELKGIDEAINNIKKALIEEYDKGAGLHMSEEQNLSLYEITDIQQGDYVSFPTKLEERMNADVKVLNQHIARFAEVVKKIYEDANKLKTTEPIGRLIRKFRDELATPRAGIIAEGEKRRAITLYNDPNQTKALEKCLGEIYFATAIHTMNAMRAEDPFYAYSNSVSIAHENMEEKKKRYQTQEDEYKKSSSLTSWWDGLPQKVKEAKESCDAAENKLFESLRVLNTCMLAASFREEIENNANIVGRRLKEQFVEECAKSPFLPLHLLKLGFSSLRTKLLFQDEALWLEARIPQNFIFGIPSDINSHLVSISLLLGSHA